MFEQMSEAQAGEQILALVWEYYGQYRSKKERIVPDCVRSAKENKNIIVRNPYSTRPYQHVLEPVMAYLMAAERQYKDKEFTGCYNFGPGEGDCWTTEGWQPRRNVETAMHRILEWNREYLCRGDVCRIVWRQIEDYIRH